MHCICLLCRSCMSIHKAGGEMVYQLEHSQRVYRYRPEILHIQSPSENLMNQAALVHLYCCKTSIRLFKKSLMSRTAVTDRAVYKARFAFPEETQVLVWQLMNNGKGLGGLRFRFLKTRSMTNHYAKQQ